MTHTQQRSACRQRAILDTFFRCLHLCKKNTKHNTCYCSSAAIASYGKGCLIWWVPIEAKGVMLTTGQAGIVVEHSKPSTAQRSTAHWAAGWQMLCIGECKTEGEWPYETEGKGPSARCGRHCSLLESLPHNLTTAPPALLASHGVRLACRTVCGFVACLLPLRRGGWLV
jgi:hypothetical protein